MQSVQFRLEQNNLALQKRSLTDEVSEILHRRIITGEYPPGEWLRQNDIAAQLDVSPTPVREALDRLVSDGLAERIPYRGVRVPELANEEIVDALVLRVLLEVAAVRLAACNISQQQLHALYDILEQTRNLTTLDDMSKHRQLNRALHLTIANAGGSPLMDRFYEMASNKFPDWMLYESMFHQVELLESALAREFKEHRALVDALASHDADLAERRAIEHMKSLGNELIALIGIPVALLEERLRQVGPLLCTMYQQSGNS